MNNKLSIKELVNVGIFTAIYYVTFFVAATTGMIPIMVVFFPVLAAILAGIPIILFFTRVNKFGSITILCGLSGFINFAIGFGLYSLLGGIICGLLADFIMKAGKYKSWGHMVMAYIVFCEWGFFTMLPMWLTKDQYFELARETQGDAFADASSALITNAMFFVVIAAIALGAIVGAYIGKAVLKKHFKKAGIV